jgi:hypothetical protein
VSGSTLGGACVVFLFDGGDIVVGRGGSVSFRRVLM